MKRSHTSTRKRRNVALDLLIFKDSEKFNSVRDEFTVFKTLEKNIAELPSEITNDGGYALFQKEAQEYLDRVNTPQEPITREIPLSLNRGPNVNHNFYVFDEADAHQVIFWIQVFVVSLLADVLLGALIISWKIN